MAIQPDKVHWDSCVFIDGLRKTAGRYDHIDNIEHAARGGAIAIYTSTLAIAEVVKMKDVGELTEDERRKITAYFLNDFVKVIPVDRSIAKEAAEIVRLHRIKPPDAIHIATALKNKVQVFYTYDGEDGDKDKLLAKNGDISGLLIEKPGDYAPHVPSQSDMFGARS